ncbi:MAG: hypothetical protein ACJAQT_005179 [Akkermansiaceae bacterium]|jgi:hypothetical protein
MKSLAIFQGLAALFFAISPSAIAEEVTALPKPLEGLSQNLAAVGLQQQQTNGRAMLRRLNRSEYENTLSDLLAFPHLKIAKSLPAEGSAHGFDKSAEALDFSHIHATRLMDAVDVALRKAIAPAVKKPKSRTIRVGVSHPDKMWRDLPGFHRLMILSSAMPLSGMEVDETVTRIRDGFLGDTRKSVVDEAPLFDSVALFINRERNLNMEIWPFEIPVAGYYKIRVNGFGVRNDRGKLAPPDRVETVGFYAEDRTLGYLDLPAYKPSTGQLTVSLEPGDVIKPLVASATFSETPKASWACHFVCKSGLTLTHASLRGAR